jgi:hypothetical protein
MNVFESISTLSVSINAPFTVNQTQVVNNNTITFEEVFQGLQDSPIKVNRHWTLQRLKTRVTRDMPKLKAALKILLNESSPLEERLQRLRDPQSPDYRKYMAQAIFSPILFVAYPDKYPVYNETVERAFEKLGIKLENESGSIWKSYPEVQKLILNLASVKRNGIFQKKYSVHHPISCYLLYANFKSLFN